MTRGFSVVPAGYVVLRRDGDVLLQLRKNTGYMDDHWAMGAAGHVHAGESVLDAAVREAREELGLDIHGDDLLPLCAMHRTGVDSQPVDQRVDFFFECRRWSGEPERLEPDKAADLRWFALDDLPEPLVAHERFVLDRLAAADLPAVVTFGFG